MQDSGFRRQKGRFQVSGNRGSTRIPESEVKKKTGSFSLNPESCSSGSGLIAQTTTRDNI
jgi:hypothetical protein